MSGMMQLDKERFIDINNKTFQIVNGPSKNLVFEACKYPFVEGDSGLRFKVPVRINIPSGRQRITEFLDARNYRILAISHEDGSGNSLLLEGKCDICISALGYQTFKFSAWYHTERREGHITFHK